MLHTVNVNFSSWPSPCPCFSCRLCISHSRSIMLPLLFCPALLPAPRKSPLAPGPRSCNAPRDTGCSCRKSPGEAERSRSAPALHILLACGVGGSPPKHMVGCGTLLPPDVSPYPSAHYVIQYRTASAQRAGNIGRSP